jgi:HIV Tat-specific factor 1
MSGVEWFYALNNDRKQGTFEELAKLLKDGVISNATLVWNATMENWKPLADLPVIYTQLVEAGSDGAIAEWHYVDKSTQAQTGPISINAFEGLVQAGAVDGKSLVWKSSLDTWAPLSTVAELAAFLPKEAKAVPVSDGTGQWYYVAEDRSRAGPFPFQTLRDAFDNGLLKLTTLIWKTGLPEWVKLSACTEPETLQLVKEAATKNPEPEKKKSNKSKKKKKWTNTDNHSNIYIQGLPKDVTVQELMTFFSDCGAYKMDYAGKPKVKVYTDEKGEPKGDGLVCFNQEASVNLALTLKDDAELRPGVRIKVQKAEFQMKGEAYVRKELSTEEIKVMQRIKLEQKKALSWTETTIDKRRIVIMKHMFTADEAQHYPSEFEFYDGIRCEVGAEVEGACGFIEKLTVFEGSPEGAIAVKFADPVSAEKCIEMFHGRWFAYNQIQCSYFDGTNYKVEETEEEIAARIEEFGKFLGEDMMDDAAAAPSAESAPSAASAEPRRPPAEGEPPAKKIRAAE